MKNKWLKTGIIFAGTGLFMIFNLISTREAGLILISAGLAEYIWHFETYKDIITNNQEVITNGQT